jgi:hypothetical protein
VTDSFNNRIVEVNRNGDILWQWTTDLALPFEAKLLANGDVLISGQVSGDILEVSRPGAQLVWGYYANTYNDYFLTINPTIICFFISLFGLDLLNLTTKLLVNKKRYQSKITFKNWIFIGIIIALIILLIILLANIVSIMYGIYPTVISSRNQIYAPIIPLGNG